MLAVQLAKEEDRAVGLLSPLTADSVSESGSEFEASSHLAEVSPHLPDARGKSERDQDDSDDFETPDSSPVRKNSSPVRKTPRYAVDISTAKRRAPAGSSQGRGRERSVSTERSPKSKKAGKTTRAKTSSVKTKRPPKSKKGDRKRVREDYENDETTESDVLPSAPQSGRQSAESSEEDEIPADVLGYTSDTVIMDRGRFAEGLQTEFESWEEFDAVLQEFQDETFQLFKKRTSTSARQFNEKSKDYQLPRRFKKYAQTWLCTHAMKTQKKTTSSKKKQKEGQKTEKKARKRRFVRHTGCSATLNATVVPIRKDAKEDKDFAIRWSAKGGHNYRVSEQLYRYYPENRLRKSPDLLAQVSKALRMGGDAANILHTLREEKGTAILSRDVHNLINYIRKMRVAGTTVEERLATMFREYTKTKGNWGSVFVNPEDNKVQSVTFQSARMRRLFNAFPEVVMVDCTHSTNRNQFVLFSFVFHDIFGKGQYVNHSLMYKEAIDNMTDACIAFKKRNPRWDDIRAFVVDKYFKERSVLKYHFPKARILLCHYHVIKYLAKKVKALVRGTKQEKDGLIHVCRALVYAKTPAVYNATLLLLAKKLGATMTGDDDGSEATEVPDEQDMFSQDSDEDSDGEDDEIDLEDDGVVAGIQAQAVRDARDDAEVKRGKKHPFYGYVMKNWETCKEEWVYYHRQNVAHLGNNTNNRIEAKWGQMKRVVDAKMEFDEAVQTIQAMQDVSEDEYLVELKQPGTRVVHDPDPELVQLLHHVSSHAYDLVKAEYLAVKDKTVNYSVREFDGNAVLTRSDDGDAPEHTIHLQTFKCSCFFAQVRLLPCRHVFFYRTYNNFESVIPIKFINLRWSLLNPTNDISLGDPGFPLRGRYVVKDASKTLTGLLTQGDKFYKAMSVFKPIAAAMSKQSPAAFEKMFEFISNIEPMMVRGDVPVLDELVEYASDVDAPVVNAPQAQEDSSDEDEAASIAADRVDASFVLPSHAKFQSARRDLRESSAREMLKVVTKEAEKFMLMTARKQAAVSLAQVQATLDVPSYNYFEAIQIVCGIPITQTKTKSMIIKRRAEHVIADSSTVRYVLEETVLKRLLADVETEADDSDVDESEILVVAVGDGKGFLSIQQLKSMDALMDAIARVNAVVIGTEWVYQNKNQTTEVEFPFDNYGRAISEIRGRHCAGATLPSLAYSRASLDLAAGADMIEIVSDNWLHTTSILAILTCLLKIKPNVAVIRPDFAKTKDVDMRGRMIVSNDALKTETRTIISIVNMTGKHWSAFHIDKTTHVCTLFDPLQATRQSGLKALQRLVEKDVAPLLSDRLTYRTFTGIAQDDYDSCGVYSAVFLEIFQHGVQTAESYPRSTALFRMRYMRMVAAMLRNEDRAVMI